MSKDEGKPFLQMSQSAGARIAIGELIFENRIPEEPKICFKRRHPLRSRFNDDERFELLKNFCGDLTSEEIA